MLRFAIIGYGHIGKRHAEIIQHCQKAELVAICDTQKDESIDIPFFASIEELFASNILIDVVIICTPNGLHAEHAIQALGHNCHVIIEKPVALTKIDAEAIHQKSKEVSKHVFCVMQNRFSQPSELLKELISKQILGDIFMVQINCFWNRDERYYTQGSWHGTKKLDGGTLFTQFSHFIDTLYWLFGDITNIKSKLYNFSHQSTIDFEDSGIITFDIVSGGMGTLNYTTSTWNKSIESSITIIGKNGSIKVSGQYMDTIEYCEIKDFKLPKTNNFPTSNHAIFIDNCVKKISGETATIPTIEDGIHVVDIIEKMCFSQRKG